MAFFGIGKKSPKAGSAPASQSAPADGGMEFDDAMPVAVTPTKKGRFGFGGSSSGGAAAKGASKSSKKTSPSKPKVRGGGGELNIYTGVLAAAVVVLIAGCVFIAMDNLAGVAGTSDEGNPFAVISSR